jgi:hypothetical protein
MDSGRRWSMGVRFGQFRLERDFADRLGGTRPRPHDIRLTTNASTPKPHRTMEPVRAASTPQITPRPRFDQVARLNRPRAKRSCSGSLPRNTKLILPIRIRSSSCSRTAGSTRAGPVHMSGRQRYQRLSRLLLRAQAATSQRPDCAVRLLLADTASHGGPIGSGRGARSSERRAPTPSHPSLPSCACRPSLVMPGRWLCRVCGEVAGLSWSGVGLSSA